MNNIHISQLVFACDSYTVRLGGCIRETNKPRTHKICISSRVEQSGNISEELYTVEEQYNNANSFYAVYCTLTYIVFPVIFMIFILFQDPFSCLHIEVGDQINSLNFWFLIFLQFCGFLPWECTERKSGILSDIFMISEEI